MLRRREDVHRAALAGQGHGDLPLEIEVLLTTDVERARRGMPGPFHVRTRLAAQKLVIGEDRLARGEACLDRDTRRLLIDRDARLAAGAAGLVPAERRHREDHLAVKGDAAVGEDGIVAEDRAAIVPSGDVGGGQNRHDAWRGPYRIEVERGDPAAGGMRGIAGRDMHQRRRLGNVVDKARRALDVPEGAVMGQARPTERLPSAGAVRSG